MKIKIFTMTHKKFEVPADKIYEPLQVGREGKENLGYRADNTGEHISDLNCYYSELTGFYWLWKNYHETEYIGTCHYRRYLLNEQEKVFTEAEYLRLLEEYDLITTKRVLLNNSYHFGFSANHNIHALDVTGEVIKELHPDYYDAFVCLVNGPETYFGNIIVTSKALFDEYCSWMFSIFFEVQKRIDMETDEDEYHKRVFGFISEFLLLVWVTVKKLKVCECKVGMLGEKAETREIKEKLAEYLAKKDIEGAKEFFLAKRKARPDILMEASDITGELRLTMQIIATAEQEMKTMGRSVLDTICEFKELVSIFSKLNYMVSTELENPGNKDALEFYRRAEISETAVQIAKMILPKKQEQ